MDKTRIIAVANHKGGVGKTTTVATLGSIFAKVGVRVLMVDLDAQCNLTDTFLSEVEGPTVYEVFKDRRDYLPTRIKDGLDILPASLDMSALDLIIGGQFEKERILSDVLEKMNISERYDLVLLDCPPSLGLVTVNALVAADEVYVPIAPEVYPLKGLVKLEEICSMVSARLNPGIGITGVIVTMFNPTKNLFVTVDEKLRGIYGDKVFRTKIRENVKLCQRDCGRALDTRSVARGHDIEAADSSRSAGSRAVFAARFTEFFGFVAEHFAGERTFADARRIGFHNADDFVEFLFGNPRADRSVSRNRRRRGSIREDTEVYIAERAELRLEHNALTLRDFAVEIIAHVAYVIDKRRTVFFKPVIHIFGFYGFYAVSRNEKIFPLYDVPDFAFKTS